VTKAKGARQHGDSMNSIVGTDDGLFVMRSGKKIASRDFEARVWDGLRGYQVDDNTDRSHRGLIVTSPAGNRLSPIPPAERKAKAAAAARAAATISKRRKP
jgi:hypothetical protein